MLSIINNLSGLFSLLSLFLVTIPVYAGGNYIFPSDIIDQTEPAQYELERVNRYENQRNWHYPEESGTFENKTFYPEPDQYMTIDDQPKYDARQLRQYQDRKKSSWYEQSDHYKYDDFNSNVSPKAKVRRSEPYYPDNNLNRETRYRRENYPGQFNHKQSGSMMSPTFENQRQQIKQRNYNQKMQQPVYASDIEANRDFMNRRLYKPDAYQSYPYQLSPHKNKRQQVRTRYIPVPVPVYNVPGIIPGAVPGIPGTMQGMPGVPGIMSSGNIIPGYNYLSPIYESSNLYEKNEKGIYNGMGSQYNPLSAFGIFPGVSSPFDSLYKGSGNNSEKEWPFLSPGTMIPGFSKSDAFSSH